MSVYCAALAGASPVDGLQEDRGVVVDVNHLHPDSYHCRQGRTPMIPGCHHQVDGRLARVERHGLVGVYCPYNKHTSCYVNVYNYNNNKVNFYCA